MEQSQQTPARPLLAAVGATLEIGRNLDAVNLHAGMNMLKCLGYTEPHTREVIQYALRRWAKGEEQAAEKGAIDESFHGVNFVSWRMVLAAALATKAN